jgi:mannose-6-phosphate isomerase
VSDLLALRGDVQHYAWGSTTLMPEAFGWPVTGEPFAELWIGDHPSLPSSVLVDGSWLPLPDVIASDPVRWLGADVVDRYGSRLPMLLKVLAIGAPLSLQVHPSELQAQDGFAREDALGIDRSAANRSYRDDRAKPEMICALTSMEALCGFRDPAESRELLLAVGGPLARYADQLRSADDLPAIVGALLSLPHAEQTALTDAISSARSRLPWAVAAVVGRLADQHPDDAGSAVALLLNAISLERGDALYLPAGNMHAYLSGLGVEVMASSDNVLRGGLTPKHVDVAELVRTLVPKTGPWPITHPVDVAGSPGVERWSSPSPEVGLCRIVVDGSSVVVPLSPGPTLFLVTSGTVQLSSRGHLSLSAGDAAFGGPQAEVTASGHGELWRAEVTLAADETRRNSNT